MTELLSMTSLALSGGFNLRANSIVFSGNETPASYGREGDVWWMCTTDTVFGFRVANPNRLHMEEPLCAFERAGAAAAAPHTTPSSGTVAGAAPATHSAGTLRLNSLYTCNGERVVVLRCRSEADDAYCSVQYPDRKSAATGGLTPELAERRDELIRKLQNCQG